MNTANRYCQQKAAKSGSSFYYSFLFLPPLQRQAILALYAFCREVDDIVDECTDSTIAAQKLEWWEGEIHRVFEGKPDHLIGQALQEAVQHFKLPVSLFLEILAGMRMDLAYQGYQTFEDLRLYCHCVASAPGLLAAHIFGGESPALRSYAQNLGIALQLVNIIRDVGEDAGRGRIYIPEEELEKFSLTPQDILDKKYSSQFLALMEFQSSRAKTYYQNALNSLPLEARKAQKSGLVMAEIYFTLLEEIEKDHFKVLHQKIGLTPIRKLWIAWKTIRRLPDIRMR